MDRKYEGLTVRGTSVVLSFTYKEHRCRETIRVGKVPTKSILGEIARKRQAILYEIDMGKFNYQTHFPSSSNCLKFDESKGSIITVEKQLRHWLKHAEKRCQLSTLKSYNSAVFFHLIPSFGTLTLNQLKPKGVRDWYSQLNISAKRINNVMIPLRQAYKMAFEDEVIDINPMERISNLKLPPREPNPFTLTEIDQILRQLTGQEKNLIQFAFWSGLRTSELIDLQWPDIDLKNSRFYVRRARVAGATKSTKTAAGYRTVDLNEQSLSALQKQLIYTKDGTHVFLDPMTQEPWASDGPIRKRVWTKALLDGGVDYRVPYQTRHSFASHMLTQGRNPSWLAAQMGHKDWGMITRIYARWIPSTTAQHATNFL